MFRSPPSRDPSSGRRTRRGCGRDGRPGKGNRGLRSSSTWTTETASHVVGGEVLPVEDDTVISGKGPVFDSDLCRHVVGPPVGVVRQRRWYYCNSPRNRLGGTPTGTTRSLESLFTRTVLSSSRSHPRRPRRKYPSVLSQRTGSRPFGTPSSLLSCSLKRSRGTVRPDEGRLLSRLWVPITTVSEGETYGPVTPRSRPSMTECSRLKS